MNNKESISHVTPGKYQESKFEKIHSVVFESATVASKVVAKEIVDSIKEKKNKPFVLGLATGSSPIGVYKELVRIIHKKKDLALKM